MSEVDHNEDPNVRYDRQRCRVCGTNWQPFKDEQGRIYAGHPLGKTCSRYRPAEVEEAPREPATSGYLQAEVVHVNGSGH